MKDDLASNAAVEIHDSTLERIESKGTDVIALINAYVHRSVGRPGVDSGTGWSQPVQLRFLNGHATGDIATIPMELLDGRLVLSGETLENTFPIPLQHVGSCRIEFESWNEARVVIDGDGVTGVFVGPPVYVEDFLA
jgi:hypothetical protein